MNDAEDDFSLVPTELDRLRLEQLDQSGQEGRVESENTTWIVLRYVTTPVKSKSPSWCDWSLIVNNPWVPARGAPYEFKNLKALLSFLDQLEAQRKKARDSRH
jgi:hypothetical protein